MESSAINSNKVDDPLRNTLKKVWWPTGLPKVTDKQFYGMMALDKVVLPEGVTAIGAGAFGECPSLRVVEFPSTLTEIQARAYYH
jgi:hypothetical protein